MPPAGPVPSREAILYSVGANHAHGLPRSNADKRRAVMTLLRDEEWAAWSDREIARRCLVHHTFVGRLRPSEPSLETNTSEPRTYTTKHGTTATMRTDRINADRPKREAADSDPAPESPTDRGSLSGVAIRVLDVSQAAARLAVSTDTVRRWCAAGIFPSAFDAGTGRRSHWRIPESDLEVIRPAAGPKIRGLEEASGIEPGGE